MLLRSLQPKYARHLMGFPQTDIGTLIEALYGIEEDISRGLWSYSSLFDFKGKKTLGGHRYGNVGTISTIGSRPFRRFQTTTQTSRAPYSISYAQYMPPTPS